MVQIADSPAFDRRITRGPIHRAVWNLSWPTILANLVTGVQGMVDHAMVGHFVGFRGNAAIGVSWQIFVVIMVFVGALYGGTGILVARFAGAGEPRKVNRAFYQAFLFSVLFGGLVIAPFGYVLAPHLLEMVHATAEVQIEALPYLRILFVYSLGMLLYVLLTAVLRAAGDVRTPMLLGILMTVLNMILTVTLVRGVGEIPSFGTAGAGIATVASGAITALIGFYLALSGRLVIRLQTGGTGYRPNWKIISAILHFGIPIAFQGVALNLGAVILIRFVGSLPASAEAQAAYSVVYSQIFSLVNWTATGIMAATATVAGQNLGAELPRRTARTPASGAVVGVLLNTPLVIVFVFFPDLLLGLFGLSDPVARQLGVELLAYLSFSSLFLTIAFSYTGALQGTGDTRFLLVIAMISQLGIPLALCSFLDWTVGLTPKGIWIAIALGHFTRCLLAIRRFRQGHWRDLDMDIGPGFSTHQGIPRPTPSQIARESGIMGRPSESSREFQQQDGGQEVGPSSENP